MTILKNIRKKFLSKIIPPSVLDYSRYLITRIFKNSRFASYNIDRKLQKYINYDYGFYVEVGANDGFTESNTLSLEIKRLWRGILIEPSPNQYLSCCFYRESAGNFIYPYACVSFQNKKKFVKIKYANLMSVMVDKNNTIKNSEEHLRRGRKNLLMGSKELEFWVLAKTLNKILNESSAPKIIDFMSIDVEGSELEVLKGINFKEFIFKYILIECREYKKTKDLLTKHGYKCVEKITASDYLFAFKK